MGVKHVEQIKAFVLFLLVSLSLVLTFLIWSYTPDYKVIEGPQGEKLEEEKELYEVIKPYRMLAHVNSSFLGTTKSSDIDRIMETFANISATGLKQTGRNLTEEDFNAIIHSDNHMTLFYPAEVPFPTFGSILKFAQNELPEESFSHVVIDWNALEQVQAGRLKISFLSEANRTLYTTEASIAREQFELNFMEVIQNSVGYHEFKREGQFSLYLPKHPVELSEYNMYYVNEIPPETFEEILFKDPNIVEKNIVNKSVTRYQDGMAMMTINSSEKSIDYVHPTESLSMIKESELLQNSIDFINDHGGLTGDYRYAFSNVQEHKTGYQLFMKDLPVFSRSMLTKISTIWGDYQVFEYKRPYYVVDFLVEDDKWKLPPANDIIDSIPALQEVDEIVLGYYLTKDPDNLLYTLTPSWFAIQDGEWERIPKETLGGTEYGLE